MRDRKHEMSGLKALALIAALVLAMTTQGDTAQRRQGRAAAPYPTYGGYGAQYPSSQPATTGSYGGYSTDPHTRALEALADKYRPGW